MAEDLGEADSPEPEAELHVVVTDADGDDHDIPAREGQSLLEAMRDYGLGVDAECGGVAACASCAVLVEEDWGDQLTPASDDELDQIDEIGAANPRLRLACQIVLNEALDGLVVEIVGAP